MTTVVRRSSACARQATSSPPAAAWSTLMEVSARLTSKGQLTVPRAVREALSLEAGDEVIFQVEGERAVIARSPDLLTLAGSVSVPAAKRGTSWDEVLRRTRRARAAARQ